MRNSMYACFAAVIGLALDLSTPPEARSQVAPGTIADGDGIFIDGQTGKIIPGRAKPNAVGEPSALGGRDLGPGAIIYRRGERLYILGAPSAPGQGDSRTSDDLLVNPERGQLNQISIQYDPPKNPEHQELYERLMRHQALETIREILAPFRLPQKLVIKTLGCDGLINSWYNRDDSVPTVHMCYELLQNILTKTTGQDLRPGVSLHDAVIGQFLFWTLHETGHAMFDILHVPLFGREEDAADEFAGFLMLHFGKDQARRWIEGAAYSAEEFKMNFGPMDNYSSVHGLPQQRFFNLICLAYGADPKTFADVTHDLMEKGMMDKVALPKRRAENCGYEFQTFNRAFGDVIRPHIDRQLARAVMDTAWFPVPTDGTFPESTGGSDVPIRAAH